VLVESGEAAGRPFSAEHIAMLLDPTARVFAHMRAPSGPLLVALFPFRPRFRGRPPAAPGSEQRPPGAFPRYAAIEIAITTEAAGPSFAHLRRNLVVSVSAAVALLASMGILGLRLNHYVRGKQVEQQVELARRVQQDLLPAGCPDCKGIDFAAACEPAWQVGGDFYDIFPIDHGKISIILGDVSGKGVPAALLMSLLHGAVRSAAATGDGRTLEDVCRHLNQLLAVRTSVDRFASLVWCLYDPASRRLSYVNAGHLPPLLLRTNNDGRAEFERLECGGPVLGVLAHASYTQGENAFGEGDLLVMFSDGLVEAANEREEEFGEERLKQIVLENRLRAAAEIRDAVRAAVRSFLGRRPLDDDLTLLVVKADPAAATRIS
jgi:sigma-B regulation protein RsbU (phosphoserine phosphatase)